MSFQLSEVTLLYRSTVSTLNVLAIADTDEYDEILSKGFTKEVRFRATYARFPHEMLAEGSYMMKLQEDETVVACADWRLP
ncbi:hypothetical protein Slin15195_G086170 [Septoria linicola]|uniref:Uncharacterized protein n=1 Tax=Septoria linicola TaxID=215465 RepID=A0A9Q9AY13_9PEZI|nr:hypothetical protein Slin14017_G088760 [Septoria linicola]USW55298.1 hypothetical protein Slin15195_G086170 [Septoria linicola]